MINLDGDAIEGDLADRAARLVVENAALLAAKKAGTAVETSERIRLRGGQTHPLGEGS
jgi:hypothetical protein